MITGDTIAAISSSAGPAARMIVRLSGPTARSIVAELAAVGLPRPTAMRANLRFRGWTLPAWLYVFNAPRSYTGEDLVEVHLPGNPLLARLFLQELIRAGARQADPGEFTARAYFNGRMNLTEAEGVAATISAHGEDELRAARRLMSGELTRQLARPIDELAEVLALVEVSIDFSEEDVSFLTPEEIRRRVDTVGDALRQLVRDSTRFESLSHEIEFVLVGRPNAGKSTLLNALCGHERAVVSAVAGTTRDVLSAEVALRRGMVRISDAAGLADDSASGAGAMVGSEDETMSASRRQAGTLAPLESASARGVCGDSRSSQMSTIIATRMREQSLRTLERADCVILVRDIADDLPVLQLSRTPDLVVRSKADRAGSMASILPGDDVLLVSAVTGQGMVELRSRLDSLAFGRAGGSSLALNVRHLSAIDEALGALARAAELAGGDQAEMLAFELRAGLDALGGIVGQVSPDDVLTRVFAAFCIGK